MSEPLLEVREVAKAYRGGGGAIEVLRDLDLTVVEGESVAVVGESGVGKSTLLHLLGGLDRPDGGSIRFRGADVLGRSAAERAAYRNRHVGFVFQFHHLLPEFTALENVEMPLRVGRRPYDSADARRILGRLGLEQRLSHLPGALSGGEQQRVAIARAVVGGPEIVLADEPTGNLDPETGRMVFDTLRDLQRESAFALVLVTHNERLAGGCDRVLRLVAGRLQQMQETETREYFKGLGA